jgi:N-carbamoyl-L-amino-acid hydrolase
MTFTPDARINLDRLLADIDRSVGVGQEGGLSRLALSDVDREMRDLFVGWCREAGLTVSVDEVGNIFGRRAGREDGLPPVLVGSHLDTQANGGRFAGILGVLGALEVVRVLNDLGHVTRRPIEIVNWTNGRARASRLPCSRLAASLGNMPWSGRTSGQPTTARPSAASSSASAIVDPRPRVGAFRMPISNSTSSRVPSSMQRRCRSASSTHAYRSHGFLVEFHGETAHTGPWPMEKRRNALVAAARLLVGVDDIGWEFASSCGKATTARLVAWPNKTGILRRVAMALPTTMRNTPLQKISSPAPTSCCMLSSSARTAETGPLADQRIIQKRRGDHELQVHCSSRSDGPAG